MHFYLALPMERDFTNDSCSLSVTRVTQCRDALLSVMAERSRRPGPLCLAKRESRTRDEKGHMVTVKGWVSDTMCACWSRPTLS